MNNNVLEFFVKMKDMMSGGLVKIAQTSQQSFAKVQNHIDNTVNKNRQLADSFDTVERRARSSSSSLGTWARSLTAAASAAAVFSFGQSAIQSAMNFGATQKSFEVLTGSSQNGQALAGGLNQLQQETILGPEVFKNAQTMMGFGIGAGKVIPTLKMLGDVSMGDADKLGALTLAFSQVQAAGRLTGQDLLQFINAGFNPLNEISKQTGLSIGELKKKMEEGAISAKMIEDAFKSATGAGGLYNGMLAKIAETPLGKLKQLEGEFEKLKTKVGYWLIPVATGMMELAKLLMDNTDFVIAAAGAWATYTVVTSGAAIAQGLLNAVMAVNPIMLLITGIALMAIGINRLIQQYGGWEKAMNSLWEVVKGFANGTGIAFREMFQNIGYWIQKVWYKVQGFFEWIGGALGNVMKALDLAANFKFGEAKNALTAEIKTSATAKLEALEKQHRSDQTKNINDGVAALNQINNGWKILTTKPFKKEEGLITSIDPTMIIDKTGSGGSPFGPNDSSNKTGSDVAKGITGGGPRVINITIGKMVEKIEINNNSPQAILNDVEDQMTELMMRILNSGAALQ